MSFNYADIQTYICKRPDCSRVLNVHFCLNLCDHVILTTERFPNFQVLILGTLGNSLKTRIITHMIADEGIDWPAFNDGDIVYLLHRNNDGAAQEELRRKKNLNLYFG